MSFKATIDIFVNFSQVQIRFLNRQGYLRYRMKIYMKLQDQQVSCQPYNIYKGPTKNSENCPENKDKKIDSELDNNSMYYYSRVIPIRCRAGNYEENQTAFFKAYVNTNTIEEIQFYCIIQCLFTEDFKKDIEVLGKFEARIRKMYQISTFLPVVFDAFEGFMILSTFHATILEFKFSADDCECLKTKKTMEMDKKYNSFYTFIEFVTNKFKREQLYQFYERYRNFLQKQHEVIQNRHKELTTKLKQFQERGDSNENNEVSQIKICKNGELIKMIKGKEKFDKRMGNEIPLSLIEKQKIVELISKEYALLKGSIYKKWMEFSQFVSSKSKYIAKLYRKQYQILCKERFKNNVFSHKIKNHDWRIAKYTDSGKINIEQAFSQKKKVVCEQQLWKEQFPIQSRSYFGKSETHVKMFEQIYVTKSGKTEQPNQKYQKMKHIVVLVHGFQASRQDFILLKNCLEIVYGIHVIISTCNEGLTENSIIVAGKRLALELKKILCHQISEYKLSFIGHSMGGLIIRSAIPELMQFSDRFYTYMTFSTPHLGYLYNSSTLVRAGLWILTFWQKIEALQEITMSDKPNFGETVLYNLSKNGSLDRFKKICLVCSSLDQYVVYQSARVEQNEQIMKDTLDERVQNTIREMVNGIIGKVNAEQISRINVVFNIQNKNLDSFIGRTSHIKFLSDIQFIREFCSCFDKFFI